MRRAGHARAIIELDDAVRCGGSIGALSLTSWAHQGWMTYRVAMQAAEADARKRELARMKRETGGRRR